MPSPIGFKTKAVTLFAKKTSSARFCVEDEGKRSVNTELTNFRWVRIVFSAVKGRVVMRNIKHCVLAFGLLGLAGVSASTAAPVSGFEALYNAVYDNCVLPPNGVSTDDAVLQEEIRVAVQVCEAAINAYSGALVAADIPLDIANDSFTALRLEVFDTNEPSTPFQEAIDALFELLLPGSGAIGVAASPTVPG